MARVVDELVGRGVIHDARDLYAARGAGLAQRAGQLGAKAAAHLLEHDLLALVRLAVGGVVVWALARFSEVTSIRTRSAVRPEAARSIAPKKLITARADRGLEDLLTLSGDGRQVLVEEAVLGKIGESARR